MRRGDADTLRVPMKRNTARVQAHLDRRLTKQARVVERSEEIKKTGVVRQASLKKFLGLSPNPSLVAFHNAASDITHQVRIKPGMELNRPKFRGCMTRQKVK